MARSRHSVKKESGVSKTTIIGGIVLAVVVIAVVLVVKLVPGGGSSADGPLRALVHDGDGGTKEISLTQDSETRIETSKGYNVVTVHSGKVSITDADCPNHDCMHQVAITQPGQQIICLPHELWIEIIGNGVESGEMDAGSVINYDATSR